MKNLIKTGFTVVVIMVLNACSIQEAPDPTTGGGAITITAQTVEKQNITNVPGTKTILSGNETHWVTGTDKIGIFSPQAKATEGGNPEENPARNLSFTAQTSAKSSNFTGTMYWGADANHNFYAYYPYNSEYAGDQAEVPISLPSVQNQSEAGNTDHLGALDFLVATPLTVAKNGAVNLAFNHVFSMIEFQIVGSGNLTQVRLRGVNPLAFSSGTIDLTQTPASGTPYTITKESTSKSVTLNLDSPVALSGSAVNICMMVLPGEQSQMTISLIFDNNWKELAKNAPTGGFERGKKYEISLDSDSGSAGWNSTLTDQRDAKTYSTEVIGRQVWMAENLAYLPEVSTDESSTESRYYVYGYTGTDVNTAEATDYYSTYGVLYNWPAAMNGAASSSSNPSGVQGVCPTGWHLPSIDEWTELETYLTYNGFNYDGTIGGIVGLKIAKAMAADSGWTPSEETGAVGNSDYYAFINKSGFSALPGGSRISGLVGSEGNWWSTCEDSSSHASGRLLFYDYSYISVVSTPKEDGFSVRCLRD